MFYRVMLIKICSTEHIKRSKPCCVLPYLNCDHFRALHNIENIHNLFISFVFSNVDDVHFIIFCRTRKQKSSECSGSHYSFINTRQKCNLQQTTSPRCVPMELIFFILIILCLFLLVSLIYSAVFKLWRSSLHSVYLIYKIISPFVNMEILLSF